MTQEEVAASMWTTKSVVSRLESGVRTRPTLSTIGSMRTPWVPWSRSACGQGGSSQLEL